MPPGNSATSSFDIDTLGPSFSSATSPDLSANGWVPGSFNGSAGSFLQVEVTDPGGGGLVDLRRIRSTIDERHP